MKRLTAIFVLVCFFVGLIFEAAGRVWPLFFKHFSLFVFTLLVCLISWGLTVVCVLILRSLKKQIAQQIPPARSLQTIQKADADQAFLVLLNTMTATTEGDMKSAKKSLKELANPQCLSKPLPSTKTQSGSSNVSNTSTKQSPFRCAQTISNAAKP